MTEAIKVGSEFLVNTITRNIQNASAVTTLSDGRFVVTWDDQSQTLGGDFTGDDFNAIRGQIFTASGAKSGSEFLVNTTTYLSQFDSAVTALSGGRFVVTWEDWSETGGDGSGAAIRGQIFTASGAKSGAEFLVNTTVQGAQYDPAITALSDGRFVVTWGDASQTGGYGSKTAIRGQIFTASGAKSGAEFLVSPTKDGYQSGAVVTALSDGRFVVTWDDWSGTGGDRSGAAIRGQIFTASGAKSGAEFLVNTTTDKNQLGSAVATLSDGRFVVTWTDFSETEGEDRGPVVRGQIFTASGAKSGPEFLVNTTIYGNQYWSAVTALSGGRFVATWEDWSRTGGDASDAAVRGQIFDAGEIGENQIGSNLADHLRGDAKANSIWGRAGNDVIRGGAGDDRLYGEAGNDKLYGDARNDVLDGGAGNDRLEGGIGDDKLYGRNGDDVILGGAGKDLLFGSNGNDKLYGDAGGDKLYGEAGNDALDGGAGNDHLEGGAGDDKLYGRDGDDVILGGAGKDQIYGSTGDDRIYGGDANDTLYGDAGDDRLEGGGGKDLLSGGAGRDRFVFLSAKETGATTATADVIMDFRRGQDLIDFAAFDADSRASGLQRFIGLIASDAAFTTARQLRFDSATNTLYGNTDADPDAEFAIKLQGVTTLLNEDFIF